MCEGNWIKLNRKMLSWEWYDDPATKIVFLHLLFTARWQDGSWHGIELKRGEVLESLTSIAENNGLTVRMVRTAISHLIDTNSVTIRKVGKHCIYKVCEYEKYQDRHDERQEDDTMVTRYRHDGDTIPTQSQRNERKEAKESKESKRREEGKESNNGGNPPIVPLTICDFPAEGLEELGVVQSVAEKLADWIVSRREQGTPITETGLKSLVSIAKDKTAKHGEDAVVKLITECMASGYKGITWDRLERARSGTTGKSEYLERIDNRISDVDDWLARREAQSDGAGIFDFGQGNEGCVSDSKFLTG